MRPVRGAPSWEFNDWYDRYYEDTHVVEPPRVYPKAREFDALDEEQARSPIVRYLSGAGPGVEAGEPAVPSWPVIQEAD